MPSKPFVILNSFIKYPLNFSTLTGSPNFPLFKSLLSKKLPLPSLLYDCAQNWKLYSSFSLISVLAKFCATSLLLCSISLLTKWGKPECFWTATSPVTSKDLYTCFLGCFCCFPLLEFYQWFQFAVKYISCSLLVSFSSRCLPTLHIKNVSLLLLYVKCLPISPVHWAVFSHSPPTVFTIFACFDHPQALKCCPYTLSR